MILGLRRLARVEKLSQITDPVFEPVLILHLFSMYQGRMPPDENRGHSYRSKRRERYSRYFRLLHTASTC